MSLLSESMGSVGATITKYYFSIVPGIHFLLFFGLSLEAILVQYSPKLYMVSVSVIYCCVTNHTESWSIKITAVYLLSILGCMQLGNFSLILFEVT